MIGLFSVLSVVVVGLAAVAAWLWWKVWRQRQAQQQMQLDLEQRRAHNEQNRIDYIHESLNVIAMAVVDQQCPMVEGCIRMAVLLDNLPLDCDTKHRFSPVFEVYNGTRHIPTHESWKALDSKQRRRYKQQMWSLEKEHSDAIMGLMAEVKATPFGKGVGASIN